MDTPPPPYLTHLVNQQSTPDIKLSLPPHTRSLNTLLPQQLLISSRTRFLLPYFSFEGRRPRKFKLESSEETRKKTKMKPTNFFLFKACSRGSISADRVKLLYSDVQKWGFTCDPLVCNGLLMVYAKAVTDLSSARKLFEEMFDGATELVEEKGLKPTAYTPAASDIKLSPPPPSPSPSPQPLNFVAFLLPPSSLHRHSIAPYEHRRAWKRRRLKPPTFENSRTDIGEWIISSSLMPFNRFVTMRCPSIDFPEKELMENVQAASNMSELPPKCFYWPFELRMMLPTFEDLKSRLSEKLIEMDGVVHKIGYALSKQKSVEGPLGSFLLLGPHGCGSSKLSLIKEPNHFKKLLTGLAKFKKNGSVRKKLCMGEYCVTMFLQIMLFYSSQQALHGSHNVIV